MDLRRSRRLTRKELPPAKPPVHADEVLKKYAEGERDFEGADLSDANLCGVDISEANLANANLSNALLGGTNLDRANLRGALLIGVEQYDLEPTTFCGANLTEAKCYSAVLRHADFTDASLYGAVLVRADLRHASFLRTNLTEVNFSDADLEGLEWHGARLDGAMLGRTRLLNINLEPLCDALPWIINYSPSVVDHRTILRSLGAPKLKHFLQRAGMPEVFIEYMVDCARSLKGSAVDKLLQSTFVAYGEADQAFARRLYEALHRNGVTTFFYAEHAKPGEKIHRVIRENVESYDRILVLCSKESLAEPRVLQAIDDCLAREARDGAAEYLIPIELDDCLRVDGAVLRKDLVRVLRDRVCADFRGAQEDEQVFKAGLRRLIAALRPPDLALWKPPGMSKPPEP